MCFAYLRLSRWKHGREIDLLIFCIFGASTLKRLSRSDIYGGVVLILHSLTRKRTTNNACNCVCVCIWMLDVGGAGVLHTCCTHTYTHLTGALQWVYMGWEGVFDVDDSWSLTLFFILITWQRAPPWLIRATIIHKAALKICSILMVQLASLISTENHEMDKKQRNSSVCLWSLPSSSCTSAVQGSRWWTLTFWDVGFFSAPYFRWMYAKRY